MPFQKSPFLLPSTISRALAMPFPCLGRRPASPAYPQALTVTDLSDIGAFTIPSAQSPHEQAARKAAIAQVRARFTYGPDLVNHGNGPAYPAGPLGTLTAVAHTSNTLKEIEYFNAKVDAALAATLSEAQAGGGLKTLDDYKKLYSSSALHQLQPQIPFAGYLENAESDILFAMSRLSVQPYSLRRLGVDDLVHFTVPDAIAIKLTTQTQHCLQEAGRLFHVDYSHFAARPTQPGRYAAACEAYFYQHPDTDEFLPLAIRPNTPGAPDLVYTPLDQPADWLFAKIMFNSNDLWHAQLHHLAATHLVIEITYMAAVRSLHRQHPVYAMLTRFARGCFAIRELTIRGLVNKGGPLDAAFPWKGEEGSRYTEKEYCDGAGAFQQNYFFTALRRRGLLPDAGKRIGPNLKHFPY